MTLLQTWEVATTRQMLIMAPYCFHIGIAIGFTICERARHFHPMLAVWRSSLYQRFEFFFYLAESTLCCRRSSADLNTIIHDNKALGVIGLYNCIGGFLALPIGRVSDTVRTTC